MERNQSLDALRGISILAMVLSGSIAFGDILPSWMYHAQVPPPDHVFDPLIPGIGWVDLVFPFFLFSMGAAIPLSLQKFIGKPDGFIGVWKTAIRRWILLTWFALFLYHMRAWVIAETPEPKDHLLSILGFFVLFMALYRPSGGTRPLVLKVMEWVGFGLSILLLFLLPFNKGMGFQWSKSDIIIIVLGNMAFFGTLLWWYTRNNPLLRLGILPFVMAVFIASVQAGSWNEMVFNWSPIPWMYKFYYLKYLFILVPGMFAGEWMLQKETSISDRYATLWIPLLSSILLISNVILLFSRHLILNLGISSLVGIALLVLARQSTDKRSKNMAQAGVYLLLLGLCFEAYEGGVKKDPSTYSYYFITSGLAFFTMLFFNGLQHAKATQKIVAYLGSNGRNPMVAYVAGSLLLLPLLQLTGLMPYFNQLNSTAWTGFLKGVLFTGTVSLITYLFTVKKWYWRT